MTRCKECKNEVSNSAPICPHCGVENPGEPLDALKLAEANKEIDYYNKAFQMWNRCRSHLDVYGKRECIQDAVDGIKYIDYLIERHPDAPGYWTMKGVLLTDGLGRHKDALVCLEKALQFNPSDLTIQLHIRNVKRQIGSCFVATAVFHSGDAWQVESLRDFRDTVLTRFAYGRHFIAWYYRRGPAIAKYCSGRRMLSALVRSALQVVCRMIVMFRKLTEHRKNGTLAKHE